jgi:hypothetical protein
METEEARGSPKATVLLHIVQNSPNLTRCSLFGESTHHTIRPERTRMYAWFAFQTLPHRDARELATCSRGLHSASRGIWTVGALGGKARGREGEGEKLVG